MPRSDRYQQRLPFRGNEQRDSVHCAVLCRSLLTGFRQWDKTRPRARFGREKGACGRLRRHPLINPIFSTQPRVSPGGEAGADRLARPSQGGTSTSLPHANGAQPLFLRYSVVNPRPTMRPIVLSPQGSVKSPLGWHSHSTRGRRQLASCASPKSCSCAGVVSGRRANLLSRGTHISVHAWVQGAL
jgi:hypothetical protein